MKVRWIFILFMLAGCSKKTDRQKFIDYINDPDNKITQHITVGEVKTTVKWLTREYRSLKMSETEVDSLGPPDGQFYYFDVTFDRIKGEKPTKEKLLYLNFDMQNDFVLLQGGDSVLPAICQKIENGMPGSYQYMLAFERSKKRVEDADFVLIYKDKMFATGILAFVYRQRDVQKIPKLKRENRK